MKNKIIFTIFIISLTIIVCLICYYMAQKFGEIHDSKYINIMIQTAVFLAGFGLLALNKEDSQKNEWYSVFLPNLKSIITWSMLSIILAFVYLIFQKENYAKDLFSLSAGFLFFTFALVLILILFYDNKYLKELELK